MNAQHFPRTVALATIAAAVMTLAQPASAGLLGGGGGGGGIGGGFGGGLGGMASPRSLSVDGAAAGQGQARREATLPRADKKAVDTANTGTAKASDQAETSHDKAGGLLDKGAHRGLTAEAAAAQRVGAGRSNAHSAADGAPAAAGTAPNAPTQAAAAPTTDTGARKPSANANTAAAGQASRSDRSVSANAAADGSVQR